MGGKNKIKSNVIFSELVKECDRYIYEHPSPSMQPS